MLRCTNDLPGTVVAATESHLVSEMAVRTMMFTCPFNLFFDPPKEATDPRFEFHVPVAPNKVGKNGKSDVMFLLLPVSFMTLLSDPTTNPAINLPKFATDDATVSEFPESLLQLPMSPGFPFVKSQTSFLQFGEGVTKSVEINL